ncbi:hypothetical protein [Streptomyces griseorubiginosus]|uniref:hypothetical protein n=1 Tax=Streptomyces griseorubiginosus TaxID=67304 RepID=UPI001AD7BF68|nr:hypothetical protein [Streptomyces griseorubiginosus]MBO4253071.1 hypothetical protein [Streptomyces griseorubiginosus]
MKKLPLAVATLPLALLGMFVTAVVPSGWAYAVCAAAAYGAEPGAMKRVTGRMQPLPRVGLSVAAASALRGASALALLARAGQGESGAFVLAVLGFLVVQALRLGYAGLLLYVWWCRRLPAVTRNVDLSALRIPDAPPRRLMDLHRGPLTFVDLPLVAGAAVAAEAGARWAAGGAGAAVLAALVAVVLLAVPAWRSRHLAAKGRVLAAVRAEVQEYEPEVVVYFSGNLRSAYQLNGWLPVLERTRHRVVIVLREREMLPRLDVTTRPVVCLPLGKDLAAFELPSARVALFAANAANNTHLLRMPQFRSVYIGHGDSDKPTSFNPFTKVYDEVWVAGPEGRERYARSGVGVADTDIVEVGRPALWPITTTTAAAPQPTVLYAPTWEGFHGDEGAATSLTTMGPALVRALLARQPRIRLLYRPHPLTGTLDRRAKAAHDEILTLIKAANGGVGEDDARLERLAARLEALRQPGGDEAQAARDSARPVADWDTVFAAWQDAYWADGTRHRVTAGSRPGLYDCFNHADVLIADVSGVVTDFLAADKPYAVTNPAGLDPDVFRGRYPAAAAGHVLGPDLVGLEEFLDRAGSAPDPLAAERAQLRARLLGPAEADPLAPFERALDALLRRAAG